MYSYVGFPLVPFLVYVCFIEQKMHFHLKVDLHVFDGRAPPGPDKSFKLIAKFCIRQ